MQYLYEHSRLCSSAACSCREKAPGWLDVCICVTVSCCCWIEWPVQHTAETMSALHVTTKTACYNSQPNRISQQVTDRHAPMSSDACSEYKETQP